LRHLILSGSSAPEAEDLIQEGFLRLFRHLGSGQKVDNPRSWLLRVANTSVNSRWTGRSLSAWWRKCAPRGRMPKRK
jgi:DNA-directed RNA polymerase specialized sigma24 family protein